MYAALSSIVDLLYTTRIDHPSCYLRPDIPWNRKRPIERNMLTYAKFITTDTQSIFLFTYILFSFPFRFSDVCELRLSKIGATLSIVDRHFGFGKTFMYPSEYNPVFECPNNGIINLQVVQLAFSWISV